MRQLANKILISKIHNLNLQMLAKKVSYPHSKKKKMSKFANNQYIEVIITNLGKRKNTAETQMSEKEQFSPKCWSIY